MIHYGEIVAKAKFLFRLNVLCVKLGKGIPTFEESSRVLLVNFYSFKGVVSCAAISSLTVI